ncbi:MAG: 1-deoxy-D-xylulose-5-phosphate synthase [Bacteroidia bacterium]|nr:1-deoxy-D-xylulose-5-phosphate synthase [Bacteroidia bacterium]MCO5252954.1 1-deoxy-D-xylulose-5-phosphate synthase [Bacteroidota bacterium]
MSWLEKINSPQDLKKLNQGELRVYADELRAFIIDTVSKTGGHFAANLGAVELAVALHYVFDTPHDKLVWDVGHQAYPHKIITGRRDEFAGLRQFDGISGFPKMSESEYDAFGTGHSSTSISAVLGMAAADKLQNIQRQHIAVIGDGALSAGQAFEGLNNLGFLNLPVIVILNDNHIGIDPVAGALNDYLKSLEDGKPNLFTRLGFAYKGGVDGHNLEQLVQVLKEAKNTQKPLLLHIRTTKGKGFAPAELEQTRWHSTSGFDKINPLGQTNKNAGAKFQDIAGKKLLQLAQVHKDVVAVTPAMVSGSSLHFMQKEYPDRVFDVAIAEQHAVTFAAGMAASGLRPFCFLYSTFLQRAMDQIIHDVCLQNLPVVFCIDRAGLVGEDGATHHGAFDMSLLHTIPNATICAPASLQELEEMMDFAYRHTQGPVFLRYPRGTGLAQLENRTNIEEGKAQLLATGNNIALLSYGTMIERVLDVANQLHQRGLNTTIINMRFVKPLDENMLQSLSNNHTLLCTFEDAAVIGGLGSTVSMWLHKNNLTNKLLTFGIPDEFIPHGKTSQLFDYCGLSADDISRQIVKFAAL